MKESQNNWTLDEWNRYLDEYIAKCNKTMGQEHVTPRTHTSTYGTPIVHRLITEDLISRYANAVGDPNPLFHDPGYGRLSRWGSMIAPPAGDVMIAETAAMPEAPRIPGWNSYTAGSKREYYKHIRPGDEFVGVDKFILMEEKPRGNKPYRLFFQTGERILINQRDEVVCKVTARTIQTATPPGDQEKMTDTLFGQRKRIPYTTEQLDAIHQAYEEELEGKWRRGAEIRYWEDVVVGEELHPVVKGPYDITDAIAFFGAIESLPAFALKWAAIKTFDFSRVVKDPETGEYHHLVDWHLWPDVARSVGLPTPIAFGTHNEVVIGHLISNWMGDDGFVKVLDVHLNKVFLFGDMNTLKGKVVKRYEKNGEHLVDIEAWGENQNGVKHSTAEVTVRLISRAQSFKTL